MLNLKKDAKDNNFEILSEETSNLRKWTKIVKFEKMSGKVFKFENNCEKKVQKSSILKILLGKTVKFEKKFGRFLNRKNNQKNAKSFARLLSFKKLSEKTVNFH